MSKRYCRDGTQSSVLTCSVHRRAQSVHGVQLRLRYQCAVCVCVRVCVMWYYWLPCVHNVSTNTFGVVAIQHLQLLEEAVNLIRLFIVPAFD